MMTHSRKRSPDSVAHHPAKRSRQYTAEQAQIYELQQNNRKLAKELKDRETALRNLVVQYHKLKRKHTLYGNLLENVQHLVTELSTNYRVVPRYNNQPDILQNFKNYLQQHSM